MMLYRCFIMMILLHSFYVQAQSVQGSKTESLNPHGQIDEIVEFDNIKELLKRDLLIEHANKKINVSKQKQVKRIEADIKRFNVPNKNEFWTFVTELWLVKNAPKLKWDFEKPAYGIDIAFKSMLESLGFFEIRYKILYLDSPLIPHMALPSNPGEMIFVLSVPFLRTLDLTKLEISLLLLEDLFRARAGYLKDYLKSKKTDSFIGSNFYEKKLDKAVLDEILKKYDFFIDKKGFTFQQQFELTKKMGAMLKSHLNLFQKYDGMLSKIDQLSKQNILFKHYSRLYPSPEMQKKWLRPDTKVP